MSSRHRVIKTVAGVTALATAAIVAKRFYDSYTLNNVKHLNTDNINNIEKRIQKYLQNKYRDKSIVVALFRHTTLGDEHFYHCMASSKNITELVSFKVSYTPSLGITGDSLWAVVRKKELVNYFQDSLENELSVKGSILKPLVRIDFNAEEYMSKSVDLDTHIKSIMDWAEPLKTDINIALEYSPFVFDLNPDKMVDERVYSCIRDWASYFCRATCKVNVFSLLPLKFNNGWTKETLEECLAEEIGLSSVPMERVELTTLDRTDIFSLDASYEESIKPEVSTFGQLARNEEFGSILLNLYDTEKYHIWTFSNHLVVYLNELG